MYLALNTIVHLADPQMTRNLDSGIYDLHCPLRKGIIDYRRDGAIFEHNINSFRRHEVDSHAAH